MDFDQLSVLLIKNIRKTNSQNRLSQKLGYEYNIVHRWESRSKIIMWGDFCDVCRLQKIPLAKALKKVFSYQGEVKDEARLIEFLIDGYQLDSLIKNLNISKTVLYNYLKGKTKAKLSFMLSLLDHISLIDLDDFLELLLSSEELKKVSDLYSLKKSFNDITIKEPKIGLLLLTLKLDSYKNLKEHSDEILAKQLGISIRKVKKYLQLLLENQLVVLNSLKYVPVSKKLVSINNYSPEVLLGVDRFWLNEALNFFEKYPEPEEVNCRKGFLYASFDDESLKELEKTTVEYFKKVQEISKGSLKQSHIRVLTINYFDPIKFD